MNQKKMNQPEIEFLERVFGFNHGDIAKGHRPSGDAYLCGTSGGLTVTVFRARGGGLDLSIHIENIDDSELHRFKEVQDLF